MKCKVGDLAIIIRDGYGDLGRLVHVERAAEAFERTVGMRFFQAVDWQIRCVAGRPLHTESGLSPFALIADSHFRPIRPLNPADRVFECIDELFDAIEAGK